MHYLVRILSYGENREEARTHALAYADRLVEQEEFDYYSPEGARTYRLTSALGQKAVEGALASNRRDFNLAMQAVRLMLQAFTDDQIYQDSFPQEPRDYYASRWQFSQVGAGHSYIYGDGDIWGEAIRNEQDFKAATETVFHDNLWVTSMDFHN